MNNIHFKIFTTELNKMEVISMCYKSHPDLKVLEGIYCSAAYPFLFKPVLIEESSCCFVDGGF